MRLFEAGEDQLGTDESEFNVVLALRSYPHLRMVFDLYEGHTGKPMEEVIESEMSGNLAKGMRAIGKINRTIGFRNSALSNALLRG